MDKLTGFLIKLYIGWKSNKATNSNAQNIRIVVNAIAEYVDRHMSIIVVININGVIMFASISVNSIIYWIATI